MGEWAQANPVLLNTSCVAGWGRLMESGRAVRYVGREFHANELKTIRAIVADGRMRTRRAISREVCLQLKWFRPDGRPKDMSCRVALARMHADGLIQLPPVEARAPGPWLPVRTAAGEPGPVLSGRRGELGALDLVAVDGVRASRLWNELVDRYHYVGYSPLAGAQVRYLAYAGGRLLAVLGFGAAAWRVYDRDLYIGWTDEQRRARLPLVVNLARFLVLPWIQIKCLASSLLAQSARQVAADWPRRYGVRRLLLESYVECDRFRGTCYRAANWICVGETVGRDKLDRGPTGLTSFKSVWCYPLHPDFRGRLCAPLPATPGAGAPA